MEQTEFPDGTGEVSYYPYDPVSDTYDSEPYTTLTTDRTSIHLGARVDDLELVDTPDNFSRILLVLPLSAMPEGNSRNLGLRVNSGYADAIRAYLDEKDVAYNYYLESERQARGTIMIIQVFSYGFIILISLICVANVFNTIATHITLRRRDFGMLRSVGLKRSELYRMMMYECLLYGSRALLIGLPVGILCSYGIYLLGRSVFSDGFSPPWGAILVTVGTVFAVVFASMLYALAKLRKDNPIDAIRMENI